MSSNKRLFDTVSFQPLDLSSSLQCKNHDQTKRCINLQVCLGTCKHGTYRNDKDPLSLSGNTNTTILIFSISTCVMQDSRE